MSMVTEGVVLGIYKVVTRSCFGVTQQHKVIVDTGRFATVSQVRIRTSNGSTRTGAFRPTHITAGYTTCSEMDYTKPQKI